MRTRICLGALLTACALVWLAPRDAGAIPAFARRYKISCTTCHAPFPRLKAYGDEFAGAGMVIQQEEKERDYVSAGDDLLWLGRDFPVAVRFDAWATYAEDAVAETDLETPWGLKLLSGGPVAKGVGYYFYFYMSEAGEVAGIEDAYLHFDAVGGSELDVIVGQFQTCDPLMKRELRLTREDYLVFKTRIGDSNIDLTYDRGLMLTYGIPASGTDLVGFVVNGSGKGETTDEDRYDTDKFKNVGFRAKQAIGEKVCVGGFAFYGKERQIRLDVPYDNEVTYFGPDLVVDLGQVAFTGQYLRRKDTNPDFDPMNEDLQTDGVVAEMTVAPHGDLSRTWLTLLYNLVDSDADAHDYETVTGSLSYQLKRNVRLVAEVTRDLELEKTLVALGMVSAF